MINVVESTQTGKPTLVFLHGLGGTLRYWNTGLDDLTHRFHVVRLDLLGFGDSSQPWQNYTQAKHLTAISSVLKNYPSFVLVGHSLGAALALAYAKENPAQVKGLVLISLPLFKDKPEAYHWMRRTPSGWLMTNMGVAALTCIATRRLAKKILPRFFKEFPADVISDLVKHNVLSSITTLWNVLYNQSLLTDLNLLDNDLVVSCIHAKNDITAPYEPVEKLVNSLPQWFLTTLESSDHHPWLWDNQACIEVINQAMESYAQYLHNTEEIKVSR